MASTGMVLDVYRCVEQPQRWQGWLDSLCEHTGAHSAVLQLIELQADAVHIVWQAGDSRTSRLQHQRAGRLTGVGNPRVDRRRILRHANRVVSDDDLFERDDPGRQALQQALAQAGLGAFLGHLVAQEGERYIGIALHREAGTGDGFDHSAPACLTALAPHVGQAAGLGQRWQHAQSQARQLQAHLDLLRCAAVVCDEAGAVQWTNRSARQLLQAGSPLGVQAGLLRGAQPAQTAQLRQEIAAAARAACIADSAPRWLALARDGRSLHIALQGQPADDGPARVLLMITDSRSLVDTPADTWRQLLGVTPAEARLVAALAQGRTLEAHAAQRGVSLGTVRNQLKQVLAKTGTKRQAELVRLALGSAAAQWQAAGG